MPSTRMPRGAKIRHAAGDRTPVKYSTLRQCPESNESPPELIQAIPSSILFKSSLRRLAYISCGFQCCCIVAPCRVVRYEINSLLLEHKGALANSSCERNQMYAYQR